MTDLIAGIVTVKIGGFKCVQLGGRTCWYAERKVTLIDHIISIVRMDTEWWEQNYICGWVRRLSN